MDKKYGRYRKKSPHWKGGKHTSNGYIKILKADHHKADTCGYIHEHILLAEKALGNELPRKAHVHHYGARNDNSRIILCQNAEYHKLLHTRADSLAMCGNANYRKCNYCKQYDDPRNLCIKHRKKPNGQYDGWSIYHQRCVAKYMRNLRQKRRFQTKLQNGQNPAKIDRLL